MPHPKLTPLALAQSRVFDAARSCTLPHSHVVLSDRALGRICASDVRSDYELPPNDVAAVDGFAVHSSAFSSQRQFNIIGSARAGHPYQGTVGIPDGVRIFTGAVMPDGPDCVLMHEDCLETGSQIQTDKVLAPGNNVRRKGENLSCSEVLVQQGKILNAADIAQLGAAGVADVNVYSQRQVSLLSMGDELVTAGHRLNTGQIYDSNKPMLTALMANHPCDLHDEGVVSDDAHRVTEQFEAALQRSDVLITTGGASDGQEDHTQAALQAIGADILFWRLAIKPGRPACVARYKEKLIFCLPGNPVAVYVCFLLLVRPALDILGGGVPRLPQTMRLISGFDYRKKAGRAEYVRATLETDAQNRTIIMPYGRKGAGVISSLTGADGLVEIPEQDDMIKAGDILNFMLFRD